MTRKYAILDDEGNPATITISFKNGTYLKIGEFNSIEAVAEITDTLKFHDINARIEVI